MRASIRVLHGALAAMLAAAPLAGCVPEVEGGVVVDGGYAAAPALTYVEPGLAVVAGWDTPVFFVDDMYWFWTYDGWYRSAWWGGPRYRATHVPPRVAQLPHPERYVRVPAGRGGFGAPGMVGPTRPGVVRPPAPVGARPVAPMRPARLPSSRASVPPRPMAPMRPAGFPHHFTPYRRR